MTVARGRPIVALAALVAGLAVAGCGSDDEPTATGEAGPGRPAETTIPAAIVDEPHGFVSTDVLYPLENAWRTASEERFTEVDAGALARDRKTGVLAIFRQDYIAVSQETNLVEVPDAGVLRITDAPTGAGVEESAQEDGRIEFEGSKGVSGTLDLSDDSIELATE